jgi:hypothetical protein
MTTYPEQTITACHVVKGVFEGDPKGAALAFDKVDPIALSELHSALSAFSVE